MSGLAPRTSSFSVKNGSGAELLSYSGVDIQAAAIIDPFIVELNNLTTLSISTHRESFPVRKLGLVPPAGFTRGPRTVAGTMVFINLIGNRVFEQFYQLESANETGLLQTPFDLVKELAPPNEFYSLDIAKTVITKMVAEPASRRQIDSLPAFRLLGHVYTETGKVLGFEIEDVIFVDNGVTVGVDESYTETTVQYLARSWKEIQPISTDYTMGDAGEVVPDEVLPPQNLA